MTAKEAFENICALAEEISSQSPEGFTMSLAAAFSPSVKGENNTILGAYGKTGDLIKITSQHAAQNPLVFNAAMLNMMIQAAQEIGLDAAEAANKKPV